MVPLELLPCAAYVCDPSGKLVAFNDLAKHLLAIQDQTPLNHESSAMGVALLRRKTVQNIEYAVESQEGRRVLLRESAKPIFSESGELLGALCLSEVISEDTVRELRQFKGLNQILGIVVSDIHGKLLEANDEYLRILGYTREDLEQGRFQWDRCTVPEHLPRDHRGIEEALRTGACLPYEKDYIRKDGTRISVLIGYSLLMAPMNQFLVYVVDLTAPAQRDRHISRAVDASQTGIWDWNLVTGDLIWSSETKKILGYPDDYLPIGTEAFLDRIHPDDRKRVEDAWSKSVNEGSEYLVEYRVDVPGQPEKWALSRGGVSRDYAGKVVRMSGTFVDITERKKAEEALKKALMIRDEFLSVASHELRTPITSIQLQTQLLQRLLEKDPKIHAPEVVLPRALETIHRQTQNLASLIEDLLDVTRILHGKLALHPVPTDVTQLLRDSVEPFSLQVEDMPDKPVTAHWDSRRIGQVIENLVSNALKYGENKPIRIQLSCPRPDQVRIVVQDQGIGIPESMHDKIFERFERVDASSAISGLGLGLYISKQIVVEHGGTIQVHSKPGAGATFTVDLPKNPTTS